MGLFDPSMEGFLWVLAISITVILIDIFLETEILSALSLLAVSGYFAALTDVSLKWQVLITLVCWLFSSLFFYLVAKKFMMPLVSLIIPKGQNESIHEAVGSLAEYRFIDDKAFVSWNGDLWPISNEDFKQFKDHDKVRIESVENGIFTINKGEKA